MWFVLEFAFKFKFILRMTKIKFLFKVGLNNAVCSNRIPCYPDDNHFRFGCDFNDYNKNRDKIGKCMCIQSDAYIWNESTMSCSDCKEGYFKQGTLCGINLLIVSVLNAYF